ncbi:MAG: Asp23/Gls24 family envelope stress response protein [Clostridia bacterium]|nr:Asp23/Gls24 family envelope stress response protein [Clostridia bacterium]
MNVVLENENGTINISTDVIAAIVGNVALNSYGVVGMSARRLTDDVAELLGRESVTKGVNVEVEENQVTVSMHVVVKYGIAINTVADNIISAVNYTIENMTGIKVSWIKFFVEGVRL